MNLKSPVLAPDWLDAYHFDLPDERIAREPAEPRDASRLLVYERARNEVTLGRFRDLPRWLEPGDVLVLNETQVIRARLKTTLERTGRDVEVLLSHPDDEVEGEWWVMLGPSRRLRPGDRLNLVEAEGSFEIVERDPDGLWCVKVEGATVEQMMEQGGHVPLPPYFRREDRAADRRRYQTVFARQPGAVAAPTAGLHFTPDLLGSLESMGVVVAKVTLHVGPGTFLPVRAVTPESHHVLEERYEVPAETLHALRAARAAGKRIIPVGTTATRCLETVWPLELEMQEPAGTGGTGNGGAGNGGAGNGATGNGASGTEEGNNGAPSTLHGWTGLTITPGFQFQATDALITNFHLPKSSLLLLVAALTGREALMRVYQIAIDAGFRFYSYGDAMLVV